MLRWGLRLFALSLLLYAVGFSGQGPLWLEVARVSATGILTLSLALILLDFLLTPDPDNG